MKARILPRDEWDKIDGMPISELLEFCRPEDVRIVVIETDSGEIAATTTMLRMTHMEGTWVSARHRNAGTVRALLRGAAHASKDWSPHWLVTGADSEQMREILSRMDAIKVPLEPYVIQLSEYGGN